MTNQTSSSPTQSYRLERFKRAVREGKFPPAGFPWAELYKLPPQEVEEWFRHPVARALLADLSRLRDRELDRLLYKVTNEHELHEARGLVKSIDLVLELPSEIHEYRVAVGESNGKVAVG